MPFGNSRVVSRTTVPEGQRENSPAFQRREGRRMNLSPEGTAERVPGRAIFQPSLRDLFWSGRRPSVETLGYFHLSLRDIHFRISERHLGLARCCKAPSPMSRFNGFPFPATKS